MSIEAMKQALEALDSLARYADTCELFLKETHPGKAHSLRERVTNSIDAITSLRQAIAEAEKQDDELQKVHSALACAIWDRMEVEELLFKLTGVKLIPKSNTPQQRTWVGLTDEEMQACNLDDNGWMVDRETAKRNVEAKLKEKNT